MRPEYRPVLLAAGLVALGLIVVYAIQLLFVLFAGVLFAVVLHGVAAALVARIGGPYRLWVGVLLVFLLGAGALFIALVAPPLADQVSELARALPGALTHALERIRRQPVGGALLPSGPVDLTPGTSDFAARALHAAGGTFEAVGALVVVFFVGVYGAARPSDYVLAVAALAPSEQRGRARDILVCVDAVLTRWLLGRLAAMAFVGVASGVAFAVLGVPLAFALAVVAGILTFVEYIGAVASAIPPILLALTKSPATALWVAAVFAVLHVIEGYVLTPIFARASARLPPAFTLASQVLFGALAGPLGVTFSTPLLVVCVATTRSWKATRPEDPPDGDAGRSPPETK